ncbi:MAG: tRNA dimethylallyltransferase (EC [uncultured Aureispira sp.]|uniref:tRNA dimethylallyltransferase n=1 Tax=uncultured Aureispira sp. TaxID=1331704 RepID=A0A6S6UDJ2_9BACT|nr:MAG: tRNA dimethylallyltransferase (EC [uncultured Aureispira sp.]
MEENTKYLIVVAGPTASGKTSLSIELAQHFEAEILSCDSRQFFKETNIGTAKPNAEELASVTHHFVDCLSITEAYNIGDYEREVLSFLETYYQKNDIAIMVGGSGMYIRAVCEGLDVYPTVEETIRVQLNQLLEEEGIEALQEELKIADPIYYAKVDLSNPHRLIRALEIFRGTGEPFSSFQGKNKVQRPFKVIKLGIDWDRAELYDRINRRVDLMLEAGLLEEAEALYPQRALNALQTVGYREFFDYFEAKTSLEEAIELVKRNTRRYAKRQLTWLRKDTTLNWIKAGTNVEDVIALLKTKLNN